MNIDEIIQNKEILDKALYVALSTMEKKTVIKELRQKIKDNQAACPHFSEKYNFVMIDDICPYCGKKLE